VIRVNRLPLERIKGLAAFSLLVVSIPFAELWELGIQQVIYMSRMMIELMLAGGTIMAAKELANHFLVLLNDAAHA
jgi:hypothetical protein